MMKEAKETISQNVTCAVETAAFTGLYSALLFAGSQLVISLV